MRRGARLDRVQAREALRLPRFFPAAHNDDSVGCAEGLCLSAGSLRVSLRNHTPLYFGMGLDRVQVREDLRPPDSSLRLRMTTGRGFLTGSQNDNDQGQLAVLRIRSRPNGVCQASVT